MVTLTEAEKSNLLTFIQAVRSNLDRIESIINPNPAPTQDDEIAKLDPGSPLNKTGEFLTERGIEVCYTLFDMGLNRHAVAKLLSLSFGAATNRLNRWEKLGGLNRLKQPHLL